MIEHFHVLGRADGDSQMPFKAEVCEPPQRDAARLDPLTEFFGIHAETIGQTDQQEVGVAGPGIASLVR